MKNNTYFTTMRQAIIDHNNALKAWQAEWDAISYGDEEARAACRKRKESIKHPFTEGQVMACRNWSEAVRGGSDTFEVRDLPWARDAHDFVEALRAAGITEFAVTERSTALMELLHEFGKEGCAMQGLCTVTRKDEVLGESTHKGILFRT